MKSNVLSGAMTGRGWRCISRHRIPVTLLLLLTLAYSATVAVAAAQRGEARVAIIVNLNGTTPDDELSFRIMNNTDRRVVETVVQALGAKFRSVPTQVKFLQGDPEFPDDKSAAATCFLPIVPRGEGYLPIAPFIEAFAPYATRLRIVYDIKGSFVYRGFVNPYSDRDIRLTTDVPPVRTADVPEALYAFDVDIKNPAMTTTKLPNYPEEVGVFGKNKLGRIVMALGFAIVIVGIGLLLALFLPKKQATAVEKDDSTKPDSSVTGGDHD